MSNLDPKAIELWRKLSPLAVDEARKGDQSASRKLLEHFVACVGQNVVPRSDVLEFIAEKFNELLSGEASSLDAALSLKRKPGRQPGGARQHHRELARFARWFLLVKQGTGKNAAYTKVAEEFGLGDDRDLRRTIRYFLDRYDVQL